MPIVSANAALTCKNKNDQRYNRSPFINLAGVKLVGLDRHLNGLSRNALSVQPLETGARLLLKYRRGPARELSVHTELPEATRAE